MISLGIDTSNYTCSVALYNSQTGEMAMQKQLLPTQPGSLGLRQSQAVFEHTKRLGGLLQALFQQRDSRVDAVGVSTRPRSVEGSYMPCFLTGKMAAESIGACMQLPVFSFSHQEGHLAAALFSAQKLDWLQHAQFLAFHLSGGTTECMLVRTSGGQIQSVQRVCRSLDLKAGQAVDRVGVALGLSFPAGPQLEQLAGECRTPITAKATMKGNDCCLSGIENICAKLQQDGAPPSYVAATCLAYLRANIEGMLHAAWQQCGKLPVLFAGGVMSNCMLRDYFTTNYQGVFAQPAYSSDNAGGIAVLAANRGGC